MHLISLSRSFTCSLYSATRHAKTAAASALGSSSPMAAPSPAAGMRKGHPASDHASYATGSVLATSSLSMSSAAASAHMSTLASHHYYKSNSSPMHPKAGLPSKMPMSDSVVRFIHAWFCDALSQCATSSRHQDHV